jgi:aspartate-semialdehyde dehydrogenase
MRERIPVGILGATGVVGQHLVARLAAHPWFEVVWVAASARSEGRRYGDLPWRLPSPVPERAGALRVSPLDPSTAPELVFSALDATTADEAEPRCARAGCVVISNARSHRMDPLVPLIVPEVNADHLALLERQRGARGWSGGIVTNPNCAAVIVALVLASLRQFGIQQVAVTTLQALSGAGYPGVAALDALGNVIPFIDGEEDKIERETRKLLGTLDDGGVIDAPFAVSAQCTRVPVEHGHTALMSVSLAERPALADVRAALDGFGGSAAGLPGGVAPLVYVDKPDRPQPKLDAGRGDGMTVSVGRLRPCPLLGYKLVALGHNVVRGAAGAAILNAELVVSVGRLLASA